MRSATAFALILAWLCLGSPRLCADDDVPPNRLAVPNSAAQAKFVRDLHEQYRDAYAKRTAADQLALAKRFRDEASLTEADPVRRYVLLREARELATNSGNMRAAFGIIDDTTAIFALDGTELKVTVMSNAVDRALIPKIDLMDQFLKICTHALAYGDLTLATHSNLLATRIARGSRDPGVNQRARAVDLRVHDARREVMVVIAADHKLQSDPDDPASNLIVGRYMCYVQDNWKGLPFLARGSDKALAGLAQKDIDGPPSPTLMADLGDAWWDFPDDKQTPQARSRERAAHWYQLAATGLSGDRASLIEKRIDEVKQKLAAAERE